MKNRSRGLDAGLGELVAAATQAPAEAVEDPAMLLDYLVDHMLTGCEQDDDVTVLVVHRTPDPIAPKLGVYETLSGAQGECV